MSASHRTIVTFALLSVLSGGVWSADGQPTGRFGSKSNDVPGRTNPAAEGPPVEPVVVYPYEVDLGSLWSQSEAGETEARPEPVELPLGETTLTQLVHFDSIDSNECCVGGTVVPPDPDIAAGPDHLIVAVNLALEIYNKTGASLLGPLDLATFFTFPPCSDNPFNPVLLYDEQADKYLITADGDSQYFCAAVSQTANPLGSYWIYQFPMAAPGQFFDWPSVGIGRDALYVGANVFGAAGGPGFLWAMDKDAMYIGGGTAMVTRDIGGWERPQPLHLHGARSGTWPQSGPHYFLSLTDPPEPGAFRYHLWSDPFGANVYVSIGDLDVAAAHGVFVGNPIPFPQAGGSPIRGAAGLFKDFEYHDGSGWTTNHVSCNPGGGVVDCIQWAEIDLDSATIVQAGVFASNGIYRTYPDLAVNACGDMAVGYTRSSVATFPSIGAAGRRADDPPGTVQDEILVKQGEVPYVAFSDRWGEYMGMTPDPNGALFWYVGEYSKNNGNGLANYGTYVSSFEFPECNEIFTDGFESGDTSAWSWTVP